MARFNADEAVVSEGYDRQKLRVGRYLIKKVDAREVIGAYRGDRFQLDFEVVKGRFAAPGTIKGDIIMLKNLDALSGDDKTKAKKDQGKIQVMLSVFEGIKPQAVTNAVYAKACREQKVKSTQEGTEIISESCPADKVSGYGKFAVLIVKPHVLKTGKNAGKKSCFYAYEAFKGDDSVFEEYDPTTDVYEDEATNAADEEELDQQLSRRAAEEEEVPPPLEEEAEPPLTLAAKAGWKFHPHSKAGQKKYFKGKEVLSEANLIAKFTK